MRGWPQQFMEMGVYRLEMGDLHYITEFTLLVSLFLFYFPYTSALSYGNPGR